MKIFRLIAGLLFLIFASGCAGSAAGNETRRQDLPEGAKESQPHDYTLSKWPEEIRMLCGSAPFPDGKLANAVHGADGCCRICFTGVSIQGFLNWLAAFAEAGWYLKETGAQNGPRSIGISYKKGELELSFTKDGDEGGWPEEMPPELCAHTPYFPFGRLENTYATQVKRSAKACICVYKCVDESQMLRYENILLQSGYTYTMNANERRWFEKGAYFAAPHWKSVNEAFSLLIGKYGDMEAPVWTAELPPDIKTSLPASVCKCAVTEEGKTLRVGFTGMHLQAAADWFGALAGKGWSFTDGTTMQNREKSLVLRITDYTPNDSALTAEISRMADMKKNAGAEVFDDGLYDFSFVLTKGAYRAKYVNKGVAEEYGKAAVLADWTEILSRYKKNAAAFFGACGLKAGDGVWVQCDNKKYRQNKHYYMLRPADDKDTGAALGRFEKNAAVLMASGNLKLRALVKIKGNP